MAASVSAVCRTRGRKRKSDKRKKNQKRKLKKEKALPCHA
jgi:hypothetical protein